MTTTEPPSRRHTRLSLEHRTFLDAYPAKRRRARLIRVAAAYVLPAFTLVLAVTGTLLAPAWWPLMLAMVAVGALACASVESIVDWELRINAWKADWSGRRAAWLSGRSAVRPDETAHDGIVAVRLDPANRTAAWWVVAYLAVGTLDAVLFAGAMFLAVLAPDDFAGPLSWGSAMALVIVSGAVDGWAHHRMCGAVDVLVGVAREKSRESFA